MTALSARRSKDGRAAPADYFWRGGQGGVLAPAGAAAAAAAAASVATAGSAPSGARGFSRQTRTEPSAAAVATHCPNSAGAKAIASHETSSCAAHAAVWRQGPGAPSVASSRSSSRSQTCTAPSAVLVTMRVPEASYAVAVTSPRVSSAVPCTNCAFGSGEGCQSRRGRVARGDGERGTEARERRTRDATWT
mgnify:CR=1 FL=1